LLSSATSRRRLRGLRALVRSGALFGQPLERYEPARAKVIVLAPHMDDEVLGCGGTMARHARAGADVQVVFLTDGRGGGGAMKAPDGTAMAAQDVTSMRKAEARQAAQVLGVRALAFMDAEDSRLASDSGAGTRLREILLRELPDIVYLPFFMEAHPDHRAANSVLSAATAGTSLQFQCRGYEVWTPLFANSLVRIDDVIEAKRQALRCYSSQLADTDYLHCIDGLNAYRAMSFGTRIAKFAEAFHALPLADYLHLYQQLRDPR
jgi:N-acetylglucosamine malate deacetylase 1